MHERLAADQRGVETVSRLRRDPRRPPRALAKGFPALGGLTRRRRREDRPVSPGRRKAAQRGLAAGRIARAHRAARGHDQRPHAGPSGAAPAAEDAGLGRRRAPPRGPDRGSVLSPCSTGAPSGLTGSHPAGSPSQENAGDTGDSRPRRPGKDAGGRQPAALRPARRPRHGGRRPGRTSARPRHRRAAEQAVFHMYSRCPSRGSNATCTAALRAAAAGGRFPRAVGRAGGHLLVRATWSSPSPRGRRVGGQRPR